MGQRRVLDTTHRPPDKHRPAQRIRQQEVQKEEQGGSINEIFSSILLPLESSRVQSSPAHPYHSLCPTSASLILRLKRSKRQGLTPLYSTASILLPTLPCIHPSILLPSLAGNTNHHRIDVWSPPCVPYSIQLRFSCSLLLCHRARKIKWASEEVLSVIFCSVFCFFILCWISTLYPGLSSLSPLTSE